MYITFMKVHVNWKQKNSFFLWLSLHKKKEKYSFVIFKQQLISLKWHLVAYMCSVEFYNLLSLKGFTQIIKYT